MRESRNAIFHGESDFQNFYMKLMDRFFLPSILEIVIWVLFGI